MDGYYQCDGPDCLSLIDTGNFCSQDCRFNSLIVENGDQRAEIARLESELRDYKRLVQALRDGKVSTDDLQPDVEILHPDWQAELLQRFKQEA